MTPLVPGTRPSTFDLFFDPAAPDGMETNSVVVSRASRVHRLRPYGPLQPRSDQTWSLEEFEPIG